MKRIVTILISMCLIASLAFAQWEWQNPHPVGYNLTDIQFVDSLTGWAVGEFGTIIHTNNAGINWEIQECITASSLFKVSAVDTQKAWAVGASGVIIHTADGGNTWLPQTSGTQLDLVDIMFINELNGWIVGNFYNTADYHTVLLVTSDGGNTWTELINDTTFVLSALHFLDENTGWAVGHNGTELIILKTTDGGSLWINQNSTKWTETGQDVFFCNDLQGWVIAGGNILHTDDGGSTWQIQSEWWLMDITLSRVYFVDSLNGYVSDFQQYEGAGTKPIVVCTNDGGLSWELNYLFGYSIHNRGYSRCNGKFFHDSLQGWAIGTAGIVMNTTDGGATWISQTGEYTFIPLTDIHFSDNLHGWAVGYNPIVPPTYILFNTIDGGLTWTEKSYGGWEIIFPNAIFFKDQNKGWIAEGRNYYYDGKIIHTTDGGENWEIQYSQSSGSMNDIYFTDINNGWAVGNSSCIIHTVDSGANWEQQYSGSNAHLRAVCFVDNEKGWSVGDGGTILHTGNGGLAWNVQSSGTDHDLKRVVFADSMNGWVIGTKDNPVATVILHTSDGGQTWETQFQETGLVLSGLSFADANHGWAVGYSNFGIILYTHDGGTTWEEQPTGIHCSFSSVFFTDANHGWIGGSNGTILHPSNGGISAVENQPGGQNNPKQALSCYPNPFSESVQFEFEFLTKASVSLQVFNHIGQQVAILVNETKSPGIHKVTWNATSLPPGLYFCRLNAGNNTSTVKIIKMQ